jgi:uncharacterized integral membrane protein
VSNAEPPETTSEPPPVDPEPVPPPEEARELEKQAEAREDEDRPSTWQPLLYTKIALLLLVVAYVIAFVVQNTDKIEIDFVFTTARVRLVWEMLLLLAAGLVSGVLLSQLYRHRRRAKLEKRGGKPRHS